jgi:hypothetical protein
VKKYAIDVEAFLIMPVIIKAESEEHAIEIFEQQLKDGEYILRPHYICGAAYSICSL